ncbi:MAG: FecR domain-containing protein [Bdellovibrionota bacterium]
MNAAIFHMLWLICISSSIYALDHLDQYFNSNRTPIAKLNIQLGEVKVRPIDLALWRDLGENHQFYEGDVISTGIYSAAEIEFLDGRRLELDENSLVALSIKDESGTPDILVTLLQGTIEAKKTSKRVASLRNKLQIKSGEANLKLNANSSLRLSKMGGKKQADLKVIEGNISLVDANAKLEKKLSKNSLIGIPIQPKMLSALKNPKVRLVSIQSKPIEASVDLPPAGKKIALIDPEPEKDLESKKSKSIIDLLSAKDFPYISWPTNGARLWTPIPLKNSSLRVALAAKSNSHLGKYLGLVKLGHSSMGQVYPETSLGGNGGIASIPGMDLVASLERTQGKSILLQAGARGIKNGLQAGHHPTDSFANPQTKVVLKSFADLPNLNYSISFSRLNPKPYKKGEWIEQSYKKASRSYDIKVRTKKHLLSLLALMNGDPTFKLRSFKGKFFKDGVYFIDNSSIVGKLSARSLTVEEIVAVGKILGAQLAFEGNPQAYLRGVNSFYQLKDYIYGRSSNDIVYLLDSKQLVPVKESLIRNDPKAIQTLFEDVQFFFKENVKIISLD